MVFDLRMELFKNDVFVKSKELKYSFFLWMMEQFLKKSYVDFGHSIVDDLDVKLLVDHDVFSLTKYDEKVP